MNRPQDNLAESLTFTGTPLLQESKELSLQKVRVTITRELGDEDRRESFNRLCAVCDILAVSYQAVMLVGIKLLSSGLSITLTVAKTFLVPLSSPHCYVISNLVLSFSLTFLRNFQNPHSSRPLTSWIDPTRRSLLLQLQAESFRQFTHHQPYRRK